MKEDKSKNKKMQEKEITETAGAANCTDKKCPVHGEISVRGRRFKGHVTKTHSKNATIEFDRFTYVKKYERYFKSKTRLHAHVPECLASAIKPGVYVEFGECRPLSKTIHHVIIKMIEASDKK